MTNTRKKNGGEVLASGGFGCVFKPSLKCKGKPRSKNKVSKLMTKNHTISEYNEIMELKKKLKHIPNYQKYFLIDNITKCLPDKLTNNDLAHYTTKCSALQKDDISKTNINKKLNSLMMLTMPDGGEDLGLYIDKITYNKLPHINNLMIELLEKGIIPMNKKGIFHNDLKDSNLLFKDTIKIIDWGLSTEYNKHSKTMPSVWRNRPLQYNVPFSCILFNDTLISMYSEFIKSTPAISEENIRPFVINFIFVWLKKRGQGHYDAINRIFKNLFLNEIEYVTSAEMMENVIEFGFTNYYIVNYLSKILLTYTKSNKLDLSEYVSKVFSQILDIWGFVMCYIPIIERLTHRFNTLNKHEKMLFDALKNIFVTYLFLPRVEPINIKELIKDINELNVFFKNCENMDGKHTFNGIASGVNTSIYDQDAFLYEKYRHPKTKTAKSKMSPYHKTRKNTKTKLSEYVNNSKE